MPDSFVSQIILQDGTTYKLKDEEARVTFNNVVAKEFVESSNYTTGQYVINKENGVNKLYKFTDDYTANDGWGNASVEEVDACGELSDINALIDANLPSVVSDWLDDHADNISGYVDGDTLILTGATFDNDDISYGETQSLTSSQKQQARDNIGAASNGDLDDKLDCTNVAPVEPGTSSTHAYKIGEHFILDGVLYIATSNIAVNDTITVGTNCKTVKVEDEVSDLKSALTVVTNTKLIENFASGYITDNVSVGTTVSLTPGSNNAFVYAIVDCSAGDKITLNAKGFTTARLWAFIDAENKMLAVSGNTVTADNLVITAPENSAKCIINSYKSELKVCYFGVRTDTTDSTLTIAGVSADAKATGDGILQLDAKITDINDRIGTHNVYKTITKDENYYWNAQTSTAVKTEYSGYVASQPIPVNQDEKYTVTIYEASSTKQYPILIVDADYNILAHYGGRTTSKKSYTFTTPVNSAYILLTTMPNTTTECYEIVLNEIPQNVFAGRFDFTGKNIAIIGDSISTNGNWSADNQLGNVPEIVVMDEDVGVELSAYATYYDIGTTVGGHEITEAEVGTEITFTPVEADVGKIVGKPLNNNASSVRTWWEVAQDILGFNTIAVCWSGSSITDHEENAQSDGHYIYKCAHAFHPSQIRKCGIRTPGTMTRTAPDMVIIYRGTNDLTHSPYARITDYLDSYPVDYPASDSYDDSGTTRYDYIKGMRMLINALRTAYPAVKIVLCTMNYFRRMSTTAKYDSGWQKYNDAIRHLAVYEGCDLIDFAKDGLTWSNAYDGYYSEGSSSTAHWTHPTTKGHKVLGNRALRDMQMFNGMN